MSGVIYDLFSCSRFTDLSLVFLRTIPSVNTVLELSKKNLDDNRVNT
jgi:hypothetical protein